MDQTWKDIIQRQFGAALAMFGSALADCPEALWEAPLWEDRSAPAGFSDFWYVGYHTLFWLDLYLTGTDVGFVPPDPFTLAELEAGVLPPRVYTPAELAGYLAYCQARLQETLETLTDEQAGRMCRFPWGELPYAELLLDNLRHVQEHGAQLRMFLGQQASRNARWIAKASP